MIDQDLLSRAEMVRSPMAPLPAPNAGPIQQSADPVQRPVQPDAELLASPVPEPMRLLADHRPIDFQPTARDP
jgi:hypothetical protein